MTQPELGNVLGVPPETIKSVENGRLEVTPRLADAIAERTGIDLLSVSYVWGLRVKGGLSDKQLSKYKLDAVLEEERRLEEFTKEKFESRAKRLRSRILTSDDFIKDIRPFLLAAYHVASLGRRPATDRLKQEVLRALARSTREVWNETMDVLPDDLPEEK